MTKRPYLLISPLIFWPGSLFLLLGGFYAWENRHLEQVKFLLAWLLPNLLLISMIPTKLPQYILPLCPPLALLTGQAIYQINSNLANKSKRLSLSIYYRLWAGISILLAFFILAISLIYAETPPPLTIPLAILTIMASLTVFYLIINNNYKIASYGSIISCLLVIPPLLYFQIPKMNHLWLTENIYNVIHNQLKLPLNADNPIYSTEYHEPSMVFMLGTSNVILKNTSETIKIILDKKRGYVLIAEKEHPLWESTLHQANLHSNEIAKIRGFRYSKGKWNTLILLRVS